MRLITLALFTLAIVEARAAHKGGKKADESTEESQSVNDKMAAGRKLQHIKPIKVAVDKNSTAADLQQMHYNGCKGLSVEHLNALSPEACSGLSHQCIHEINVTNLHIPCLMHINELQFKDISLKTFTELMNSDPEHMFFTIEDVYVLVPKFADRFGKFPATFMSYCAASSDFAEALIESLNSTRNTHALVQFFTSPYIEKHDPTLFRLMSGKNLEQLPAMAFKQMSKDQFARIPPSAFKNMTPAQFESIPPGHFEVIKAEPLGYVSTACLQVMTPQQARSLGANPDDIPQVTSQAKIQRDTEIIAYRLFVERHPCQTANERISLITSQNVKDALLQRCSKILNVSNRGMMKMTVGYSTSDASMVSYVKFTALIASAALVLFL